MIIYRFRLQGRVLSVPLQAQTVGGQTLSVVDPPGEPRHLRRPPGKESVHPIFSHPILPPTTPPHTHSGIFRNTAKSFGSASLVRPRREGHVGQGRGSPAGDLRPNATIQSQFHPPACWLALRLRRHASGGVQERGQAQQQQSTPHLKGNEHRSQRKPIERPSELPVRAKNGKSSAGLPTCMSASVRLSSEASVFVRTPSDLRRTSASARFRAAAFKGNTDLARE